MDAGMGPARLFELRSSKVSELQLPRSSEIGPVRFAPEMVSLAR